LVKALIFDVDGTIAETEELHRKAYNTVFLNEGLEWSWSKELYKKLLKVAGGKERIKFFDGNITSKKYHLNEKDILKIHNKKNERYNQWVNQGFLKLRPGIKSLIDKAIDNNLKLAISTSTSTMNVKSLFENCFGIDPNSIFNAIATGEMVKRKKPDSELYLLALNKLSLDPSVCIAFEDSNIGLLSAKKAKITTICSPSEYHLDDDFKMADFICEEFTKEKLPSNLRQLILS
tara:strand:- start:72 stop:770 length:699 start_codon:yes stop_codon:yes gene_type:complete